MRALLALGLLVGAVGCQGRDARPNVLWIVWDTVRADHLSLYGYDRPTTPRLDAWARSARVFDDSLSVAGYTLPSHASMFTGLLPSEHCTHNANTRLADGYTTVAELLQADGYRTYLFSANPHISSMGNLDQGFERVEHPWSPDFRDEALRIVRRKLPEYDRSSELGAQFRNYEQGAGGLSTWNVKAAGGLARPALLSWLSWGDERPFFAFINYMEAHRPYIPPREYRERIMTEEQVARSYEVDRSWTSTWEYVFGLREYDEEELELTAATYDAALMELDDLLGDLLDALESGGHLDDTVVILTSDHGEHLGEQHMLDHQYSVYQPLLRVPLIVHYPKRFAPGREGRPVSNIDLFGTVLELAGVEPPPGLASGSVSLLEPRNDRTRFAEDPSGSPVPFALVRQRHPDWDSTPWERALRAWVDGDHKLIWGSDGRHELFDLARDPDETHSVLSEPDSTAVASTLQSALATHVASFNLCTPEPPPDSPLTPDQRNLLRSLGYLD